MLYQKTIPYYTKLDYSSKAVYNKCIVLLLVANATMISVERLQMLCKELRGVLSREPITLMQQENR